MFIFRLRMVNPEKLKAAGYKFSFLSVFHAVDPHNSEDISETLASAWNESVMQVLLV